MNKEGMFSWLKRKLDALLIFFHLKKKDEEEQKKKDEEVRVRMSKPELFGKFFLGFFLGIIEYAVSRPNKKDSKELVDLDEINEEIKNLNKKLDWLEGRLNKERRPERKKVYEQKIENTKEIIKELKDRIETIKYNKEKAKEIKRRLDRILIDLEAVQKEVERIKVQISTTNDIPKLQLYQQTLTEKENKLNHIMSELDQVKKDYDRFQDVDITYTAKEDTADLKNVSRRRQDEIAEQKLDVTIKVLPLTKYVEQEIIDEIVITNKKLLSLTKNTQDDVKDTKAAVIKKENDEKERLRREAEERLNAEVEEVKSAEMRISASVKKTEEEIEKLRASVEKVKKVKTKQVTHFKGISKMIGNVSKMAFGLLSFTVFRNPGVGMLVGTVILNNSIRGLRNAVRLNKRRITYYKYTDLTNEILKQKSTLKVNQKLMTDSLKQIASFKIEFQQKFSEQIKELPEYQEIFDKVEMVERELLKRNEELKEHKKNLEKVEKKNEKQKQKVAAMSSFEN